MKRASRVRASVARRVANPIVAVATPSGKKSANEGEKNWSKVEHIKENSDFLRHPLTEQLATEDPFISEDAAQLYKFHGGYQQDETRDATKKSEVILDMPNIGTGYDISTSRFSSIYLYAEFQTRL